VAKLAYAADSRSAVRKDVWVRVPPAAPFDPGPRPLCRARPPDPISCIDDRGLDARTSTSSACISATASSLAITEASGAFGSLQDARYPRLIDACAAAVAEVSCNKIGMTRHGGAMEVSCYWKHWPCVFPQIGPGRKHHRPIQLEAWQQDLVDRHPRELVKGLIHSNGCRVTNRVRNAAGRAYEYPRYFFSNRSKDIHGTFVRACHSIGVECRPDGPYNISVARRRSVAILDEFIGPKG
jgi:hypothetical protein